MRGRRTLIVAIISFLAVQVIQQTADPEVISQAQDWAANLLPLVMIVMRLVTSTPVMKKS